ncbi:MAG TPA: MlaD family protein [Xanthomonadales bacterium]|nr:MlaD family protein [Xanthomonadales bacterium]
METRASYVLIGGFALAIRALAVAFALWLAKASLDREFDEYDIVFTEAVTGLSVAGAVQYNGIQIGAVRKLSLDPRDPRRVVAHVRVAAGTPVKADTRAKLTFTGLTGVAIIQLTDGTPAAPPLVAREGEAWPTIVADDSALQKLMASSEDMLANATETIARLSQLLSEENLRRVAATLEHIEAVSGALAEGKDDVGLALRNLADASATLKGTLARADALVARLDAASGSVQSLVDDEGRAALAELREALVAVRTLAANADALLAANRDAVDDLGSRGLTQVGPMLAELRATIARLDAIATRVERDPAAFLLGGDRPPERSVR